MAKSTAFELSSSQLYNFKLSLTYDSKGNILDVEDFKKKLVSTLKAPITSAEYDAGKKQQQITAVIIFVTFDSKGNPAKANFRKKLAPGTPIEYVICDVDGDVHLIGSPQLTPTQEKILFNTLAREIYTASPFDDLENGKNIHNAVAELAPELKLRKKK